MDLGEAVQTVIIDKLKRAIIDNDMVATRALLNSVHYEKTELLEQIVIEIKALDYIVGLDHGVPPGPNPNVADIAIWIRAKGLDLNPWAVSESIGKNGTTWYRQGGSHIVTDTVNKEAFNQIMALAKPEIKGKIKEQFQLLFRKKGEGFDNALSAGFFD